MQLIAAFRHQPGSVRQATVWSAAAICIALGLIVLAGWQWDLPSLRSLIPGAVQMKANTSLGLLAAGGAVLLKQRAKRGIEGYAAFILPWAVFLLGAATLLQYIYRANFGIDQALFLDSAHAYNAFPGRMSPLTAWAFVMIGLSLSFLGRSEMTWLQIVSIPQIVFIGLISLLGYLWNASEIVTDRLLPPVAANTAFALTMLGLGLFAAHHRAITDPTIDHKVSSVEVKLLMGLGLTLLLIAGAFGYTYRSGLEFLDSMRLVQQTSEVRLVLKDVEASLKYAETNHRSYFMTQDPLYRADFQKNQAQLRADFQNLSALIEDNPGQLERLEKVNRLISAEILRMDSLHRIFEKRGVDVSIRQIENQSALRTIRAEVQKMDEVEEDLFIKRKLEGEADQIKLLASLLGTLGLAMVIFIALVIAIHREMIQRKRVKDGILGFNTQLKARVAERTAALELVNVRLSEFTRSLAHDLRQPLMTASGFVGLLSRQAGTGHGSDSKSRDYLKRIGEAVGHIGTATDVILELTKISQLEVHQESVDISAMALDLVSDLQKKNPLRNVDVSVQHGMTLVCDNQLLSIALTQVLDNAWKFTATRTIGKISIGLDRSPGNEVTVWVKDDGIGFDMTDEDKLCAPFSRLHSREEFGGLGTGLAIAQAAMSRQNGRIWATSILDSGATFNLAFPDRLAREAV